MKKTKILTVVLCLILALSAVGFVACGDKHNFETAWTYDTSYHWHKCTDEGCTEVSDKAPHNFVNGVCECGAKEEAKATASQMVANFVKSLTEIGNSQGYNLVAKGITCSVDAARDIAHKDSNNNVTSDEYHIPVRADLTADVEIFAGKDAEGNFEAKGSGSAKFTFNKNTTNEYFKDYKDVLSVATAKASFVIKGGYVYAKYELNETTDGLPAGVELDPLFGSVELNGDIKISIDDIVEMIGSLISSDGSFAAMAETLVEVLPQILDELEAFVQPIAEKVTELSEEEFNKYFKELMELSYKITEKDGGYSITINTESTKTLINDMCDLTLAQVIDKYAGEKTVEKLAASVKLFANMKVKDIINFAETNLEFDLNDLAALANEILAVVKPAPADKPEDQITVEKLLNLPSTKEDGTAYTFKDFVLDFVGEKTVAELIESVVGLEKGAVEGYVDLAVDFLNKNTLLDVFGIIDSNIKVDEEFKKTVKETALKFVEIYESVFGYEINVAKDGSFKSLSFGVNLTKETIEEIFKLIEGIDNEIAKRIPNFALGANFSVSIGEFKNELGFDYDKLVSDLDAKDAVDESAAA